MADKKISELPAAGTGNASDLYPVVQGSSTRKQTRAQLKESLGAASSGDNSDITSLSALSTALSVSQGGTGGSSSAEARTGLGLGALAVLNMAAVGDGGTGATTAPVARANLGVRNPSTRFIDGFELTHGSPLSLSAGAAWIPGTSKCIESAVALSIPLSGLTVNAFYHIYVFENAGVLDREIVTTAPALHASGGWIKTGDASRRYVASVLANSATGVYRFTQDGNRMFYNEGGIASAPFAVLSGTAVAAANVACSGAAPVTAFALAAMLNNTSTTNTMSARIGNSALGTVSSSNHRQVVPASVAFQADILLDASQQFSYIFDAAPNGALSVRANGYKFRR